MTLKAKRQIRHKSGAAVRLWHELRDVSIDWCSLIALSVLATGTLYNMILTYAAAGLRLLDHHITAALMQLASALP